MVVSSVSGQESPSLQLDMYTYNTTYRQDVCYRHDLFYNGTVELRDALSGFNLHVFVPVWDDFYFKLRTILDEEEQQQTTSSVEENAYSAPPTTNVVIDETNPGLIADVLDELSRRANFTWRNTFGYNVGPGPNKTWTELLQWSIEAYDISADEWFHTSERLKLGIGYPEGIVNVNIIMVDTKSDDMPTLNKENQFPNNIEYLWSWTKPFSTNVWLLIVITAFLSAVIYAILEKSASSSCENESRRPSDNVVADDAVATNIGDPLNTNDSKSSNPKRIIHWGSSLFGIILIFFQHVTIHPKTIPGKIMVCSIAFWSLVIVATYTANLASVFVIQNTPPSLINNIQDAIDNGLSMCLYEGIALQDYVTKYYPKGIYVPKDGPYGHFDSLLAGDGSCDLTLATVNAYNRASILKDVNKGCQLNRIGRVVHFQQGGFATKTDSGIKCTSLISDVINVHLLDMKFDGTLDKITEKYLANMQDITCTDDDSNNNDSGGVDEGILSLKEMSGVFVNHSIALLVAIVFGIIGSSSGKKKRKTSEVNKSTQQQNDVASNYTSSNTNNTIRGETFHSNETSSSYEVGGSRPQTSSSSTSLPKAIMNVAKKNDNMIKNSEELSQKLQIIAGKDKSISLLLSALSAKQTANGY